MIEFFPGCRLNPRDVEIRFVRSSGPGGQNVNKVSSKIELRFLLEQTRILTPGQKRRLVAAFPSYVTREGQFLLTSDVHRTQVQNQRDVLERLARMVQGIRFAPKPRVGTRPTRASKRRRVANKRAQGEKKKLRRIPKDD